MDENNVLILRGVLFKLVKLLLNSVGCQIGHLSFGSYFVSLEVYLLAIQVKHILVLESTCSDVHFTLTGDQLINVGRTTTLLPFQMERSASFELLGPALADAVIYKVIGWTEGVFDLNVVFISDVDSHVLHIKAGTIFKEVREHVSGI